MGQDKIHSGKHFFERIIFPHCRKPKITTKGNILSNLLSSHPFSSERMEICPSATLRDRKSFSAIQIKPSSKPGSRYNFYNNCNTNTKGDPDRFFQKGKNHSITESFEKKKKLPSKVSPNQKPAFQ